MEAPIKRALYYLLFFFTSYSLAQTNIKVKVSKYTEPLNFAAEKSNIQVLPQKFEFTLADANKMKLGDILIDTTQMNFDLLHSASNKNKGEKKYNLLFTWPAALLQEGQIILFSNYGKSIWTLPIQKQNIKIIESANADSSLRVDIAEFTSSELSAQLLEEMKYLPFMKFCILKIEDDTRLQLCSRDFSLIGQSNELVLKPRAGVKKTAELLINNKIISSGQALIFLNDPDQNINLKSRLVNGSFLEFETRMRAVEFQDAFISDDEKLINLRAYGAVPVKEGSVEYIGDKLWKTQLPITDPVIYLKGVGGIPMRQEFFVRGIAPKQAVRPHAQPPVPTKTYSSSTQVYGRAARGTVPFLKEKNSDLKLNKNGEFIWTLEELESYEENKRALSFRTDKSEFAVFHKVSKGKPYQIRFITSYESPSNIIRGQIGLDWWFENFLWINREWNKFHWGLQLDNTQATNKVDNIVNYTLIRLSLLYRFTPGFHFVDPSWGIKIPYQIFRTEETSLSSPGLGIFYSGNGPGFSSSLFHWFEFELNYFTGAKNSTVNLQSLNEINALFYYKFNKTISLTYGMGFSQAKVENSTETSKMQAQAKAGLAVNF